MSLCPRSNAAAGGSQRQRDVVARSFGADGYCGLCDEQMLNDTWRSWFAEQVAYANAKGLEVSAYTLMQHNYWGETVPASEQALGRDGKPMGVACFGTDWHARYRANVLEFIRAVSLGGCGCLLRAHARAVCVCVCVCVPMVCVWHVAVRDAPARAQAGDGRAVRELCVHRVGRGPSPQRRGGRV